VEETEPDDEDMVELHVVQADDIKREKGTRPSSSEFFPSRIRTFFPSRIGIKEFKYFYLKIVSKL
jgi:hypothetical protein